LWYLSYVFRALINSLECWFCTSALGLVLFQISELFTQTKYTAGISLSPYFSPPVECPAETNLIWSERQPNVQLRRANCNNYGCLASEWSVCRRYNARDGYVQLYAHLHKVMYRAINSLQLRRIFSSDLHKSILSARFALVSEMKYWFESALLSFEIITNAHKAQNGFYNYSRSDRYSDDLPKYPHRNKLCGTNEDKLRNGLVQVNTWRLSYDYACTH